MSMLLYERGRIMQKKDEKRQDAPDVRKKVLLAFALVLLAALGYLFLQLRAQTASLSLIHI